LDKSVLEVSIETHRANLSYFNDVSIRYISPK